MIEDLVQSGFAVVLAWFCWRGIHQGVADAFTNASFRLLGGGWRSRARMTQERAIAAGKVASYGALALLQSTAQWMVWR